MDIFAVRDPARSEATSTDVDVTCEPNTNPGSSPSDCESLQRLLMPVTMLIHAAYFEGFRISDGMVQCCYVEPTNCQKKRL